MNANLVNALQLIRTMDRDDLHALNQAVVNHVRHLDRQRTREFRLGQMVTWLSKFGQQVYGRITKINPKTIQVMSDTGMRWRVSPSLLKVA